MLAKYRTWLLFCAIVTILAGYWLYGRAGYAGLAFASLAGLGYALAGLLPRARAFAFVLVSGIVLGVAVGSVVNKPDKPAAQAATTHVAETKTLAVTPPTPTDTPTVTPTPTATPVPPTATPLPPCRPASAVTLADVGQQVCVYGEVTAVSSDGVAQYIRFGGAAFQVLTYELNADIPHPPGNCFQVEAYVIKLGSRPSIIVRDPPAPPAVCGQRP
jgi:hypothetical protein